MTASLWEFIVVSFFLYLLVLLVPFANLLWVMTIKLFMGGSVYQNNVTPGEYPKWSRMHLRIWCIGRMQKFVLRPLDTDVSQCAAESVRAGDSSARKWARIFSAPMMLTFPGRSI